MITFGNEKPSLFLILIISLLYGIILQREREHYFLTSGFEYPCFLLAWTLVTFISFVDDIKSAGQMTRLLFHFCAMAMMFYQWGLLSLSGWWIVIGLIEIGRAHV